MLVHQLRALRPVALLLFTSLAVTGSSKVHAQDFSLLPTSTTATISSPAQATTFSFSGTVTNLTSDNLLFLTGVEYAYDGSGDSLGATLVPPIALGPNETFTGNIFSVTIAPNQAPGFYSKNSNGNLCEFLSYDVDTTTGNESYYNSPYSVTILPAVPEASTTVSFGLLLALGLGVIIAKKKKASPTA